MSPLIYEFLENTAAGYPDFDAIRWLEKKEIRSIKYRALVDDISLIRRGLLAEDFSDEHIVVIGGSSKDWVETYLGIVTGPNTAIPLDAAMPEDELFELINRSDASGIFLDKLHSDWVSVDPDSGNIRLLDMCPAIRKIWMMDGTECGEGVESLSELMEKGRVSDKDRQPSPDDTIMIIYTSGTTGVSKGVMLSQSNLAENVEPLVLKKGVGVTMLNVLPIHHAFCLVMDWLRGFANASTICINDSLMHMVRNMSVFKPVSTLMVPLMIETIYKRVRSMSKDHTNEEIYEKVFGGSLKRIYSGGAHLDPFYVERFGELGIDIYEGYGMSECSPVISANTEGAFKPGSVGKPLKNVELKFEDGEILVKGTSVMQRYYKMPDETSEALKDGWLHTGDRGYLDEDGFLYINGRIKNLIILSNGENISPEEIENKLALEPLVGEVIIEGKDHGLVAHIYPDKDVVGALGLGDEQVRAGLQKAIDKYNESRPSYYQIVGLNVRKYPFIKSSTKKIKRMEIDKDEPV